MSNLGPLAFGAFKMMFSALADWRNRKKAARQKEREREEKRRHLLAIERARSEIDAAKKRLAEMENARRRAEARERLAESVGPAKPLDENPYGED